jgi:3-oxoacyl-[acyl-carrier-protein] synthase-1
VGVGARTHAGLTALQATLAARADKLRPVETHMVDRFGEPVGICRLGAIADNQTGLDRLVELGYAPLIQASYAWNRMAQARSQQIDPLPVIVAVPPASRPGADPRLGRQLLPALESRSGVLIDHDYSSVVAEDRGGGITAFARALQLLERRPAVLVGGIDSYFDPDTVDWLDREYRLHGLQTENGIIPGEAAAFVLLAQRSHASALTRFGQVLSADVQLEPRPYGSDEPCHGLAMTLALRNAAGPVGAKARRVGWALTDVANERHRVDEWELAAARAFEVFADDYSHDQPLLNTGEVGAASAPLLVVMACVRWQIGCAVSDCAMIAAHSDGAERGALLATREQT